MKISEHVDLKGNVLFSSHNLLLHINKQIGRELIEKEIINRTIYIRDNSSRWYSAAIYIQA